MPEGVPAPGEVTDTDAVNVTLPPKIDGFTLAPVIVVPVSALLTVWLNVDAVLLENCPLSVKYFAPKV